VAHVLADRGGDADCIVWCSVVLVMLMVLYYRTFTA
jgi:hypothetical protein